MFAIVSYNKNQYLFEAGKDYDIVLNQEEMKKKKISFFSVLLISDSEKNIIGQPEVSGASVEAEILDTKRGKKIPVIKFHAKKRYQRIGGQRQNFTKIKIFKINQKNEK